MRTSLYLRLAIALGTTALLAGCGTREQNRAAEASSAAGTSAELEVGDRRLELRARAGRAARLGRSILLARAAAREQRSGAERDCEAEVKARAHAQPPLAGFG